MPAAERGALTSRQRQVLATIRLLTAQAGYPPTLREIGEAVGLASASSVHHHVRTLEQAGFVSPAEGRPRVRAVPVASEGHTRAAGWPGRGASAASLAEIMSGPQPPPRALQPPWWDGAGYDLNETLAMVTDWILDAA